MFQTLTTLIIDQLRHPSCWQRPQRRRCRRTRRPGVQFNRHLEFWVQIWDIFRDNFTTSALWHTARKLLWHYKFGIGSICSSNMTWNKFWDIGTNKMSIELHPCWLLATSPAILPMSPCSSSSPRSESMGSKEDRLGLFVERRYNGLMSLQSCGSYGLRVHT